MTTAQAIAGQPTLSFKAASIGFLASATAMIVLMVALGNLV